jgi:hypothetical protein
MTRKIKSLGFKLVWQNRRISKSANKNIRASIFFDNFKLSLRDARIKFSGGVASVKTLQQVGRSERDRSQIVMGEAVSQPFAFRDLTGGNATIKTLADEIRKENNL